MLGSQLTMSHLPSTTEIPPSSGSQSPSLLTHKKMPSWLLKWEKSEEGFHFFSWSGERRWTKICTIHVICHIEMAQPNMVQVLNVVDIWQKVWERVNVVSLRSISVVFVVQWFQNKEAILLEKGTGQVHIQIISHRSLSCCNCSKNLWPRHRRMCNQLCWYGGSFHHHEVRVNITNCAPGPSKVCGVQQVWCAWLPGAAAILLHEGKDPWH